jgi:hypothetical protein
MKLINDVVETFLMFTKLVALFFFLRIKGTHTSSSTNIIAQLRRPTLLL